METNTSEIIPEPIEGIPVEAVEEPKPEPEVPEVKEETPQAKRKPGRPSGAKDKVPRPKSKVIIKEEPIEVKELPRVLESSLPIPTEPETDKAALMLKLLNHQAQLRKNAKTELWERWFVR